LDKVDNVLVFMGFLGGAATVDFVCRSGGSVMVTQTVQMDQMNPPPLVVHLPAPVIQTFVFQLDRRFHVDKAVETALLVGVVLVGAVTVDNVWRTTGSVMVHHSVQMNQMNPPQLVVNLPVPVIQTFVFQLDRRLDPDKTVDTALLVWVLVGAATVESVCGRVEFVMVHQTVQMDQMNPPPILHHSPPKFSDEIDVRLGCSKSSWPKYN